MINQNKNKLFILLPWVEKVLFTGLIIGAIFYYLKLNSNILIVSSLGLAFVFFIHLFMPLEIYASQEEADKSGPWGMMETICLLIIPKMLWISCGLSAFAWSFILMGFVHKESFQIPFTSGLTIVLCFLLLAFGLFRRVKPLRYLGPVVLRAILFLVIDCYLVFKLLQNDLLY